MSKFPPSWNCDAIKLDWEILFELLIDQPWRNLSLIPPSILSSSASEKRIGWLCLRHAVARSCPLLNKKLQKLRQLFRNTLKKILHSIQKVDDMQEEFGRTPPCGIHDNPDIPSVFHWTCLLMQAAHLPVRLLLRDRPACPRKKIATAQPIAGNHNRPCACRRHH